MDVDVALEPLGIISARLAALARDGVALLPNLVAAVVVVLLTALVAWLVGLTIRRGFARSGFRPALVEALNQLGRVAVWAAGLLIVATVLFPNLTPANALAGLGIGSIAVGLAFKDIFENFLAGFLILLRKPMRIGDDIDCEGIFGRVERITLRDTFLRKRSGELVLLPNSFLFKNPLEILTDRELRRVSVVAGVAYGENVDEAREVIHQSVRRLPTVARDRPVEVFATGFGASSIDYTVRWWTKSAPIDEHRSRDEVVAAIKAGLDAAGIEIPFPYRTLTFKDAVPLRSLDDGTS
jgi:small-conductance mechanosensitive channel